MLRPYQQRSIDMLYQWFNDNPTGHPCLVLPTGAGKSHIVAALCKDAIQSWPGTRLLMLTHSKELISQNAEKMRQHWQNAPLGIYSASLNRRELNEPITFAGIQSVRKRASQIGHVDLIIVDECHLISHKDEGGYRTLINGLTEINPNVRVIGLTASPFRLGHGRITDGDAIFSDLIEPVSVHELINDDFLATLRSKVTSQVLSADGVHKRGGEYIAKELQDALNTDDKNEAVVNEVIAQANGRKSWLFFCTGVEHAQDVCIILQSKGINAECLTGQTPKAERERILSDFKSGRITALTNCEILTTGFDHADLDLIAFLRPTMSPVLYQQMAGRGLRKKSHTDHCLVLDFAGVVRQHGPITDIKPPTAKGDAKGEAPIRVCDECGEICHAAARVCTHCGLEFPIAEKKKLRLHSDDIMGYEDQTMQVTSWNWSKHVSKKSGAEMLKVKYYGGLSDEPVTEYLVINHDGYAGQRAQEMLQHMAQKAGANLDGFDLTSIRVQMSISQHPEKITYKKAGKFFRVLSRQW